MGTLAGILEKKREMLPALRRRPLPDPPPVRPLSLRRMPGQPLRLIAEIKRRSPSAGALSTVLSVEARASAYERAGAAMLSILCDETYFEGDFEHITRARAQARLPILCKDFVLDPVQIDLARAHGADAVLLIVRCLTQPELLDLTRRARERELVPFVEVTSEEEAQRALDAGADLIGVNARNLDTLMMDISRAERVITTLPPHVTRVHLSGISTSGQVAELARSRTDAALIGEALMRKDDPEPLLRALVQAATLRG